MEHDFPDEIRKFVIAAKLPHHLEPPKELTHSRAHSRWFILPSKREVELRYGSDRLWVGWTIDGDARGVITATPSMWVVTGSTRDHQSETELLEFFSLKPREIGTLEVPLVRFLPEQLLPEDDRGGICLGGNGEDGTYISRPWGTVPEVVEYRKRLAATLLASISELT